MRKINGARNLIEDDEKAIIEAKWKARNEARNLIAINIPDIMKSLTTEQLIGLAPAKNEAQEQVLSIMREETAFQIAMELKKGAMKKYNLDFEDVFKIYKATINSKKTLKQYTTCIEEFEKWLDKHDKGSILLATRQLAMSYLLECKNLGEEKHYSSNWFVNKYRGLSSFFTWLEYNYSNCDFKNIFRNSKIKFKEYDTKGKLFTKDIVLITENEIDIILKELTKIGKNGIIYYLAVKVMIECGLRVGGLKGLNITKRGANYNYKTISKGNANYKGVISKNLVQEIENANLNIEAPFKNLNYNTIKININRIKVKHNMSFSGGCHAFRHYAAVMLYNRTKNITKVMRFLNHSKLNTTGIYLNHLGLDLED
jgi:integrase